LKRLKKLKPWLLISSWALLSACNSPPNFFACADLGDSGHCVEYLSKKKFDIDEKHLYKGKPWSKIRAGSVVMPSDQIALVKTFFDNFCHQNSCPDSVGDWSGFIKELGAK
jgi:hypothetical protein